MKAYIVFAHEPESGCDLVFAETGRRAKVVGYKLGDTGDFSDWIDVRVSRAPGADHWAGDFEGVVWNQYAQRDAGFMDPDGDIPCAACSRYSNGLEDKRVCAQCDRCPDCGCADGCQQEGRER